MATNVWHVLRLMQVQKSPLEVSLHAYCCSCCTAGSAWRGRHGLLTSTRPAPFPHLPCSYVRHPMYSGLLLAGMGLAAVTHSEIRLALATLLWYVLEQKIQYEERELVARYPQTYREYQAKVKKLIPFVY